MGGIVDFVFGKDDPAQADTSGMNRAAEANAAVSKESLDFYKQMYAEQAPARAQAAATAQKVADAQLASMTQNDAISKDYYDYQKGTFRPVEQAIVADAQNYDTAARRESKASQAVADVGMQASIAQQSQMRNMNRMGINPNSGRSQAIGAQMGLAEAAAKAGAANKARMDVETQGHARMMDAASLGRGLAGNQATSAGIALNAGNAAVGSAGTPLTQANQAAAMMGQGFNTAIAGNNGAGSIYSNSASANNNANSTAGGLGSMLGSFMGSKGGSDLISAGLAFLSDETKKKDIKPITDEQALAAVEKTPYANWNYKPGQGDGGNHTGPMAQDVQKNMGDAAAPGGKQIDPITLNGITMAGVAALSRKVDKLAKQTKGAKA